MRIFGSATPSGREALRGAVRASGQGGHPVRGDASAEAARALELAAVVVEVARELGRTVPPPRGAPYFCLDSEIPYDLCVFDALSARGIFRKYELVLVVGSGLGGTARWLAARFGCRILGVDTRSAAVQAAAMLNQRAQMQDQVTFQVGRSDRLPLRDRVFTHVWMLDGAAAKVSAGTLVEAFRVLRPGGHLALQCAPLPGDGQQRLGQLLRRAGFVGAEISQARLSDPPHATRVARQRLRSALQRHAEAAALWPEVGERAFEPACLQIFARRPS